MDDREQINTLVSVGTGLPPVNPYLDDTTDNDAEDTAKPKSKAGKKPGQTNPSPKTTTIIPDPKEYIAELERPEEDSILY